MPPFAFPVLWVRHDVFSDHRIAIVDYLDTLDDPELITGEYTLLNQVIFVGKPGRFDNQPIALPTTDGFAIPVVIPTYLRFAIASV